MSLVSKYLLWLNNVDQNCVQKFLRCRFSFLYDGTHHIKHEILNFIGMIFTKIEKISLDNNEYNHNFNKLRVIQFGL